MVVSAWTKGSTCDAHLWRHHLDALVEEAELANVVLERPPTVLHAALQQLRETKTGR